MAHSHLKAIAALVALLAACPAWGEEGGITWQEWGEKPFEQAKAEHKLVLLDVRSAWCHWCHVMDTATYGDKAIIEEINKHYVPVSVDQDSHPDISHRYENYGWPATIIFKPDGTEIVKRRGYIEADTMKLVLAESFADPKPSPNQTGNLAKSNSAGLTAEQHDTIFASIMWFYDKDNAGWGDGHKFIEPLMMEFALNKTAAGNNVLRFQAENTLKASYNLIDQAAGGVYQYSDAVDWKSPHYEKIMSTQAAYVVSYAYAFGVFHDNQYREALSKVVKYLDSTMTSPGGAFYTSQDADVSDSITGKAYYALDEQTRKKYGVPKIDKNIYSSVNGSMISAYATAYAMTGDVSFLNKAVRTAKWVQSTRITPEGGFKHGEADKDGPFLADTLGMVGALLDLYSVTGERTWLADAQKSTQFMLGQFQDKSAGGFYAAVTKENAVLKPFKQPDENIAVARLLNRLSYYSGDATQKKAALAALQNVSSAEQIEKNPFNPGLLLADKELKDSPLHLTVVGAKTDPKAKELFVAAIGFAPLYKQTEWYDRKEGKLPNSDIDFPELPQAAAFVCNNKTCSLPLFDVQALKDRVEELKGEE